MDDRALLEAAAKAAGLTLMWGGPDKDMPRRADTFDSWNPMQDDGDALRLAVKLRIFPVVEEWSDGLWVFVPSQPGNAEPYAPDPFAATRRAIVRAAAAMSTP